MDAVDRPQTLVVGLTGGIATGKSTVAGFFEKVGVPVIDSDRITRELVEPGQTALDEIVKSFGNEILNAQGELDRRYMRERIFADPQARSRLEDILHPKVYRVIWERINEVQSPYCIVVVPLLVESADPKLFDRILVVDMAEQSQLEHLMTRDHLTLDKAKQTLRAQATRAQRLAAATEVIVNDGAIAKLEREVGRLHEFYMAASGN